MSTEGRSPGNMVQISYIVAEIQLPKLKSQGRINSSRHVFFWHCMVCCRVKFNVPFQDTRYMIQQEITGSISVATKLSKVAPFQGRNTAMPQQEVGQPVELCCTKQQQQLI